MANATIGAAEDGVESKQQPSDSHLPGLRGVIKRGLTDEQRRHFFDAVLPATIRRASRLLDHDMFPPSRPVHLLVRGEARAVRLSKAQVGSLLSAAFLGLVSTSLAQRSQRCL